MNEPFIKVMGVIFTTLLLVTTHLFPSPQHFTVPSQNTTLFVKGKCDVNGYYDVTINSSNNFGYDLFKIKGEGNKIDKDGNKQKIDGERVKKEGDDSDMKKEPQNFISEYCIIGAGPAGLQMGYFLQKQNRKYVILERNNQSGSFFSSYPRHRKLISINKEHTGKHNKDFNLRHDWNSLLSDDGQMLYKHFSKDFFPHADTMVKYLNSFTRHFDLNVKYGVEVKNLRTKQEDLRGLKKDAKSQGRFRIRDQKEDQYTCRYVIVATGLHVPNSPSFEGHHLATGYEDVTLDVERYRGKTVLILGRGNAAFETADSLYGVTNAVHIVSRSRAKLAWSTHYVGDLRAVNNNLLDTYQLKSLDGLLESNVEDMRLVKRDGKIVVRLPELSENDIDDESLYHDNFALRDKYDFVIRCLGFKFDYSIFEKSLLLPNAKVPKYPSIKNNYESSTSEGIYFAGTATHSLDFRRSAGGFIHGFRYSVRSLHRLLEWRHHSNPWPVKNILALDLLNEVVKRLNEASGTYQMFGELGDVILLQKDGRSVKILEEVPLSLLGRLKFFTGHEAVSSVLVVVMEYGESFSGAGADPFRTDRAVADIFEAHKSNFLHPVLYYYDTAPNELSMFSKWRKSKLPKPTKVHHVIEDFLTDWTAKESHILPLRRFLEYFLGTDLRQYFAIDCLLHLLTERGMPVSCNAGTGVPHKVGGLYKTDWW